MVVAGEVGSERVIIPWKALGSESCAIELQRLEITLAPRPRTNCPSAKKEAYGDSSEASKEGSAGEEVRIPFALCLSERRARCESPFSSRLCLLALSRK